MNSKHIKRDEKRWRERYKREKVREREREEKWERERGEREFYVEKHLRRDRDSKKKTTRFCTWLTFPTVWSTFKYEFLVNHTKFPQVWNLPDGQDFGRSTVCQAELLPVDVHPQNVQGQLAVVRNIGHLHFKLVLCNKWKWNIWSVLEKFSFQIHCIDFKAPSNTHIESERKERSRCRWMNMFIIETSITFLSYNRIFVEFIELMKTAASFYTQRTLCANMMHWMVYRSWQPIKTIWTFLYQSNEGCFQFMKSNLAVYFLK